MRRAAAVVAAAFGMSLAFGAPAAVAGQVTYDGDAIVFTAGDDLDHELRFRLNGNADDVIDSQPITSAPGDCMVVTATWVSCPAHLEVRAELGSGRDRVDFTEDCFVSYTINLGAGNNENSMADNCGDPATATVTAGGGNDFFRGGSSGTRMTVFAGAGRDSVDGGEGPDVLHGGEGPDAVSGKAGSDQALGEGGDDRLRGEDGSDLEDGGAGNDTIGTGAEIGAPRDLDRGADQLRGGTGADSLHLGGHPGAVALSLDGQANDGTPGERDNVSADIESIIGTSGNDAFTGSAGPNAFDGGPGGDQMRGGGGNDNLRGNSGDDRVFGDGGDDKLQGDPGTDAVDGGPGADQLNGDIAGCSVFCSPDVDALFARDGERDTVNCGGPGTAQVDGLDVVGRCGSVDRVTDPRSTDPPAKAKFAGSRRSIRVSRSGRFRYSFRAGSGLSGRAVFRSAKKVRVSRRARVTLAGKSFTAPASGKVTLRMRLSRKNLATLRRNRRIRTKVTVRLTNAGGSSVASRAVTLKR